MADCSRQCALREMSREIFEVSNEANGRSPKKIKARVHDLKGKCRWAKSLREGRPALPAIKGTQTETSSYNFRPSEFRAKWEAG